MDRRGRQSRGKGSLIRKFFSPSSQSRRQPVPLPFLHNKRREEEYKKFIEEKHHQQSEFHTFPNSWHLQVKYVIYVFEHCQSKPKPLTITNYQMSSVVFSSKFRRFLTMNRRFFKLGSFCPEVRPFLPRSYTVLDQS